MDLHMSQMKQAPFPLLLLAPETITRILSLLDISDVLHISQTCKHLRALAVDPILHLRRLRSVPTTLVPALKGRPARHELLSRRTPLISLNPHQPSLHLLNPASAQQIKAYIAVSRLLTSHRLRRLMDKRATIATLHGRGLVDVEVTDGKLANSLVPAMRQLKKAQKSDSLRRGMRDESEPGGWRTPAQVFQNVRGVWNEDDPRVVSAVCPSVKSHIRFWEALKTSQ